MSFSRRLRVSLSFLNDQTDFQMEGGWISKPILGVLDTSKEPVETQVFNFLAWNLISHQASPAMQNLVPFANRSNRDELESGSRCWKTSLHEQQASGTLRFGLNIHWTLKSLLEFESWWRLQRRRCTCIFQLQQFALSKWRPLRVLI